MTKLVLKNESLAILVLRAANGAEITLRPATSSTPYSAEDLKDFQYDVYVKNKTLSVSEVEVADEEAVVAEEVKPVVVPAPVVVEEVKPVVVEEVVVPSTEATATEAVTTEAPTEGVMGKVKNLFKNK